MKTSLAIAPIADRNLASLWHREFMGMNSHAKTESLMEIARRLGVSFGTARRKYDLWRKHGGNTAVLLNKSRLARPSQALNPAFLEWFRALAESHQRATRPAYREFLRRWHSGQTIPGLDPHASRHILPRGCSYANLQRQCRDTFALKVMRIGLGAARSHAPQVFTTRAGLWVGSHYMFDDVWHDNFVIFQGKLVRVLEFNGLDVFTGFKNCWGCQPRIQNADGSFENLKERHMRMLLAGLLFNEGYNSDRGTVLMAEHGTAAIRENMAALLSDRTDGKISVRRSGITGKEQAVAGMGVGRGGGNFRFKSMLESLHNLIHNEMGLLPTQTGKDVDHRPERTHGDLTADSDLLKVAEVLARTSPDRASLLRYKTLEYHSQFLPLLTTVYDRINRRDWHALEGWHACGNIEIRYRLSPTAADSLSQDEFLALPESTKEMVISAATSEPRFLVQRRLSPAEVWNARRSQLTRLPAWVVAEILGPDFAAERKVSNSYFEFQDIEISPEPLRYEARITDQFGHESELAEDKYLVFVNPFAPDELFVHDAKTRFIGVAKRVQRVCRADIEAINRANGRASHRLADKLAPIRARHSEITRQATLDATHNADVIAGATRPEEIAANRVTRKLEDLAQLAISAEAGE